MTERLLVQIWVHPSLCDCVLGQDTLSTTTCVNVGADWHRLSGMLWLVCPMATVAIHVVYHHQCQCGVNEEGFNVMRFKRLEKRDINPVHDYYNKIEIVSVHKNMTLRRLSLV